jgi:hypothetical protein
VRRRVGRSLACRQFKNESRFAQSRVVDGEFLADKPLFCGVADEFLAFVGDAPLVAHNAGFDVVGDLPLISDPWLQKWSGAAYGFSAPASGNNTYAAVIFTEPEIEMPTVHGGDGNMNPRIFQLGLLANLTG